MTMRQLSDAMFVAGQILPEDMPGIAAQGVTAIVNNRPDDEELDQPTAAEIGAAATAAGLAYWHIPVAGGLSPDQVATMAEALESGTVLAFCKSGTRSAYLWALAEHSRGGDGAGIIARAQAAGYDLTPLRNHLLR